MFSISRNLKKKLTFECERLGFQILHCIPHETSAFKLHSLLKYMSDFETFSFFEETLFDIFRYPHNLKAFKN